MTRLLTITILCCLLFASCNKEVSTIPEDGALITFSSAFAVIEKTKANISKSEETPNIHAHVLGSRTPNEFTALYTSDNTLVGKGSTDNGPITVVGATLDQEVLFINGKGNLPMKVAYPTKRTVAQDDDSLYVRAYAPANFAGCERNQNRVTFKGLTGKQDVLLTDPNVRSEPSSSGDYAVYGGGNIETPESRKIALNFNHKLSGISFRFKAEDDLAKVSWGNIMKLELVNYPTNITLHLNMGTIPADPNNLDYAVDRTSPDQSGPITVFESDADAGLVLSTSGFFPTAPQMAMVPPTEVGLKKTSWQLRITYKLPTKETAESTVVSLPDNEIYLLLPGQSRVYKITLRDEASKLPLKVVGEIVEWNVVAYDENQDQNIF